MQYDFQSSTIGSDKAKKVHLTYILLQIVNDKTLTIPSLLQVQCQFSYWYILMPTWGRSRKKNEQQTCLPPPYTIILKYYDNHFIIYLIHIIIHLFQFYTNIELEKNLEHTFSLHERTFHVIQTSSNVSCIKSFRYGIIYHP